MIANEREYRITRAASRRLERALASPPAADAPQDPALRQLLEASIQYQIDELRAQLTAYEALRAGQGGPVRVASLGELPEALIQARILGGLTQRELAERLGVTEQQVQRDEARRYARARFDRLLAVAAVLGVRLEQPVVLTQEPLRVGAA